MAFRETPPAGVIQFTGVEPSSCSFWRLTAGGRTFYTIPSDHYNCAIGSYTHNIPLPPERAQELDQMLTFMTGLGYVRMEEIPAILRLSQTPQVVIYAPLGDSPLDPDVVLFAGLPRALMFFAGGCRACRDRGAGCVPGSPDVYGSSRGTRFRRYRELGMYRQQDLH